MASVTPDAAPARVFISYKRDVQPDEPMADRLYDSLTASGHDVFVDRRSLRVGQQWASTVEGRIRQADYLILLVTQSSVYSEMVKGEVELARKAAGSGGRPVILPVRLAFFGPLPYPLNAYLDGIQYAPWRGPTDTEALLKALQDAVAGADRSALELQTSGQAPAPPADPAPLYSAPLPPPGGAIDTDDPRYVRRNVDDQAAGIMKLAGQTLVIKGPRQMGKSSLLVRAAEAGIAAGKKMALIDFQLFDSAARANADRFFRDFARSIAEQLEIPASVADAWDANLSNPQNCTRYVESQILKPVPESVLIAIDEADAIFDSGFRADFFAMLRNWHNNRAHPVRKKWWKKLDIALVTSTEPYMMIDRPHESPFNVGLVLALQDFGRGQLDEMNRLHGAPLAAAEVDRLHVLLNGHPYLSRKAFYAVAGGYDLTPAQMFDGAAEDNGPFGDHLRHFLLKVQAEPELAAALSQIVRGRGGPDESITFRLEGAGLVKRVAGKVVPRCELYGQYFLARLASA